MSADQGNQVAAPMAPTCMASVNRIVKLPVVESTYQVATSMYEKIKEYNSVTNMTCTLAENTVNKVVEVGKPIATPMVRNLEGPIKKVDGVLCTGLDYVETKVPAVKLPPAEIYSTTKEYVTPVVESARAYAEPAVKTARDIVEPRIQQAKTVIEPAFEKAKNIVEPAVESAMHMVEPAVQKAKTVVDEYLHPHQNEENVEQEGDSHEHHD